MTDAQEVFPPSFPPAERPPLARKNGRTGRNSSAPGGGRSRKGCLRETVFVIVIALALSLGVKTFLVQSFYIPSSSMESTLLIDDRIIVNKMAGSVADLHHGDVVVFVDPGGWLPPTYQPESGLQAAFSAILRFVGILPQNAGEHLIKRVIGLPGDTVKCCTAEGQLTVNGVAITEPYLDPEVRPSEVDFEVTVPENSLWVMGDNRQGSRDSRAHMGSPGGGFVPDASIEGRAAFIIFPFGRMAWLGGADSVFTEVPAP